jgi:Family of unknown function (DUF5372)
VGKTDHTVRITHPFHPLAGRELALVCRRPHWGEDRIMYACPDGMLRSISTSLTDVDPPDEFRRTAGGRAAFRTVDLLELCALLQRLRGGSADDV